MIEQKTQNEEEKDPTKDQIGQMDTYVSTTQVQGAPPQITVIEKERSEEDKESPKEKEKEEIQTLINSPMTGTPTRMTQKTSTEAIPLQISTPGSRSRKVARVLHY